MRLAGLAADTIRHRLNAVHRLERALTVPLLAATVEDLRDYETRFANLAPASVNIYCRHIQAFYGWALARGLIPTDPSTGLIVPKVRRGRPHPTTPTDLRVVFACTTGPLRLVYALATFAGLRRGEICQLQCRDLDLDTPTPTMLVQGKGGRERRVPILPPLLTEIYLYGLPRTGWLVTVAGKPYPREKLSIDSHFHLRSLGLDTTLHGMRHTFLTNAAALTHDPLFVRDLAGHQSVATTEIYMETSMSGAHARLAGMTGIGADLVGRLRAVPA